jgi:hypothetical protein
VKEGFSWPAFFFSVFWASHYRLWKAAAIYFFAQYSIYQFFLVISPDLLSRGVLFIGLAIIFGYVANDLRQRKICKEGFTLCAVVKGKNGDHSYGQFLARSSMIISDVKT